MQFIDLDDNAKVRLVEPESLDDCWLIAQQRLKFYQTRIAGAFNKRVKFPSFGVGDLFITIRRSIVINGKTQGKLKFKWEGPYVVTKVFPKGAYEILNRDG